MKNRYLFGVLALLLALAPMPAYATSVSITLTTYALGLGAAADITNGGKVIDANVAGALFTATEGTVNTNLNAALGIVAAPKVMTGSVLNIQTSNLAGAGTGLDPLLVRVTAAGHLDNNIGGEFQSGVIWLSADNKDTSPEGEGLGVRAFTVTEGTIAPPAGARVTITDKGVTGFGIEGSKEVSGGTDPDLAFHNGAPHVDELAFFDFTAGSGNWDANKFKFVLTAFESTDKYYLQIRYAGGTYASLLDATGAWSAYDSGTKVLTVDTSKIVGIPTAKLYDFYIRAVDPNPAEPKGTAEHFLINGFTVNDTPVPEPASLVLLGSGLVLGANRLRRRKG